MKTAVFIVIFVFLVGVVGSVAFYEAPAQEPEKQPETWCPKTRVTDNNKCMLCHVQPDWALKEAAPDRALNLPFGSRLVEGQLHYVIDHISSKAILELFDYLSWHPQFDHIVLEIHSPGGSLLDAWRIIGLIEQAQNRGMIVETRVYGFAASAGFLVACAGNIGHRFFAESATLMHHELWSLTFLAVDTPSSKEQEAIVMRQLQDHVHEWLVTRSTKGLTKEQLDEWVRHKDFYMTGAEAVELGFGEGVPR